MTVNLENVAILTTSDIQRWKGDGPVSTGKLEHAIAMGLAVHVVSTRDTVVPETDDWWMALVPTERTFFADKPGQGAYVESWSERDCEITRAYSAGWVRLFAHLGVEWPMQDDFEGGMEPVHWDCARDALGALGALNGNRMSRAMRE